MSGDGTGVVGPAIDLPARAETHIELLRHGETGHRGFRGQLDDLPTAGGIAQMRAAVAGGHWDAVVSSPLRRCALFAREFAAERGVPLRLEPCLAEYRFGRWQGMPMEVLAQNHGEALARFWADPAAHPPPDAETIAQFEARVRAALAEVATLFAGRRVLVVTHGGVIRLLMCATRGLPWSEMAMLEVAHASLHRLPPTPMAGPDAGKGGG
ncbi:histidine phosphatase family protein [Marilutibacter chinensis]|uniref:Histidine phosphatase family protein n=1 Tax=Marilutibacter chinensis TaxID=2912247 RepID=A0ABS9HUH1_9GAMM|nr:histidine phosphatase family protein [Lysobacter chinensis]MCF7222015.1 histidine phosphatase family protein [Lysobacter chinensis]